MDVQISARCISTEEIQNFIIKLHSNVKCIWDLKKMLESKLSVAACDQTIYFETHLLEDTGRLQTLYVQEGDGFNVEFLVCCNIKELHSVLCGMKTFFDIMSQSYIIEEQFLDAFSDVYKYFETLSNDLFFPWNNPMSIANRHFFTQEGGLDTLASIYKHMQSLYRSEHHECTPETEIYLQPMLFLENLCLLTLWNYSELVKERKMVLKKIGLDAFVKSLILEPNKTLQNELEIQNINESAAGCLAQYIEMADIQQIVAKDYLSDVTQQLLRMLSHSTCVYNTEVAANTLFCCSSHPTAALRLVETEVHMSVMEKMIPEPELVSKAVQYFLCLFLANVATLPEEQIIADKEKLCIDKIIEQFILLNIPSEVGDFHDDHQYVWISLIPFVEIAFSGFKLMKSVEKLEFSSAGKVGLFSLCHLTKTKANQELFKKENLVDYLVCVCWFARKYDVDSDLVPELTGFEQMEPPRLQSIAKAYLAMFYRYRISQKYN